MFRTRKWRQALLLVVVSGSTVLAGGCGPRSKLPPMAIVTGRVTFEGEPLTCGEVGFIPDSLRGGSGPMGMGVIGEDGRYEIRTAGEKGAVVGWHRITVVAIDEAKPDKPWIIPIEYGNPDTSGIAREVKANQENVIDLELKRR